MSLEVLKKEVKTSMKAAFAEGTSKNLKVQWRAYLLFCKFYGLKTIPATTDTLCLYGQFLGRSFKSVESIRNYISGVKTMHLFLGMKFPEENWFQIDLVFKGLARIKKHTPNRALPMTPQILREIYTFLDMSKSDDITFWCLCLFMFFLMARKSNLVPISVEDFDPSKQLIRQDVKVFQDVLVVLIKWSKTNQFGSRLLQVPLVAIPESVLCPVLAFKNMIRATPALVHDPAFVRRTDKGRIKPLLYKHLQEKIKILISKTGRDPQLYSSHSFRRGGCTWAFKAGVPTDLIQHHGDWLSDCYKRYLAFDFKEKLSVSEAMAREIIFLD